MRQLAKMELESELNHSRKQGKIEGIKEGELKGIKKGKIEGIKEGKLEIAVNLLSRGMELDLVSEITNIPIAKLKSLKH
jgi:predicted transposase/invertase (TIGR01784 family)